VQRIVNSYVICIFALTLLISWQNGSCRTGKSVDMPKVQNRVATGDWGGPNVRMNVYENGAKLQFSCAHGSIDEPIVFDSAGHFSVKGTFTAEAMGPLRVDNPPKSGPALYSGTVSDTKLSLTIAFIETKEKLGEFSLELGKPGRVFKCH
jgi:hypothetical protein